ncbi:PREDICTED: glycine-rich RNA-binding protein 2, mitochondrial-like isoform X2 [Ipomoea nil]|uniref:glycine-rich RNA-binding protein 2, mitochondrial-like isoform X2 n=1 Tax=Ipomoea nil TaxID=35883 RepID=UPI00090109EF|nr:PREDICTED: glycine-rich RNA-binding protein 2, mitochondrial-like isoform X2 [Ipomoea nil]
MAFFSKAGNVLRQVVNKPQISHEISASTPSVFQILRFMSSSKVFVGGISWSTSDASLQDAFRKYGDVIEARIITDRETGRSRGFGFVTFGSPEDASAAIQALDGQMLDGRSIRVNFANERPPRSFDGGSGGGGYGGGRYGGGGGYGGEGGYGGSGNFGGQGGEGSYGANNYGSGGSVGYGGDNQNFGAAGGDFPSAGNTFASSGFEGNTGFGYGSNNQYGDNASSNTDEAGGDDSHPEQGSFRDDDDQPDDYAKRA